MGEKFVTVPLYEFGDWVDHDFTREFAKPTVRDMIKQMSDEPISWLVKGLTLHQLQELAEATQAEMRERERAGYQPPATQDVLKLLAEE
jgi:hypothetical protein